ncbi:LysE family translocator [Zooshikella harenae]|uniref:LysE family transporter n=1 Tax=Zooshikella harenae TaxID=2827238 RepID=A0ABS5ZIY1_9GAMM|nr:LysE family transporter [Zooshikella harenae]MBU2713885.1 LysE family transporter [Zooshikella harenae]
MPLIVGIQLGLFLIAIAAVSGLAVVLERSIILYNIIQYAGLIYLLYLGIISLIAAYKNTKISEPAMNSFSLKHGFVITCFSPKTLLFFASFFYLFISKELSYLEQVLWLISVLLIITLSVHILYSLIMEKISWIVYEHSQTFNFVVGFLFIILVILLAVS